ncbi:MAG: hypothetical protein CM1200mP41_37350 [Gammaproteobacteria bacterium]|nr:MAG: hypothetical protein CM1200mP41_37350 [Gammaproteobacteria bacterium]
MFAVTSLNIGYDCPKISEDGSAALMELTIAGSATMSFSKKCRMTPMRMPLMPSTSMLEGPGGSQDQFAPAGSRGSCPETT